MRKATPTSQASLLRKAILQAAVQGKLVPQDASDEPASVLLECIKAEKARLVKEGKLKKEKPLSPVSEEEQPFDLPVGWVWVRLGEISNKITDGSHNPPPNSGRGYFVISAKNIKNGEITFENVDRFTDERGFLRENPRTNISFGDIIMGIIGGSIGNVAIYNHHVKVIAQRSIAIINSYINNSYVKTFLNSPFLQLLLNVNASGTAQGGIYLGQLKALYVPLPPLAEQKRIVTKVNELMLHCDQLERTEQAALALDTHFFETLPKCILQAAVQGKLVPQDENDEPASVLLERIKTEKARLVKEGKLKKEKPLPPVSEEAKPFDLPVGWVWVRLGEVVSINPKNKLDDDTEVAFLPMALISQDYFGGHQQEMRTWGQVKKGFTHFAEGDILLAKITPCFENGKSCIARDLKSGFGAGTTELHVLRCIEIFASYLLMFLKNPMFLQDAAESMTGTAGQQRVPTEYLRNYVFALPPMEEQKRITATFEVFIQNMSSQGKIYD